MPAASAAPVVGWSDGSGGRPNCSENSVVCTEIADPIGSVIVGMKLFGVSAHVRDICDRLASLGYLALRAGVGILPACFREAVWRCAWMHGRDAHATSDDSDFGLLSS